MSTTLPDESTVEQSTPGSTGTSGPRHSERGSLKRDDLSRYAQPIVYVCV